MQTIWKLKEIDHDTASELAYELSIPRSIANVALTRNIATVEEYNTFRNLTLKQLHNPSTLPDVAVAIERLQKALINKEKIYVFGDYDVDGLTSTAVVVKTLQKLNADVEYHVPHRVREGYDLKVGSIQKAIESGAKVMLSVDCGTSAFEAATYAKEHGLDLIITDHHMPNKEGKLPDCLALINPNRKDSEYPFSSLAGVGVAFKFMLGLVKKLELPLMPFINDLIEYVALGTVADVAPMIGENRVLVRYGCPLLSASKKVGIQQLLKVAGVKEVNTISIGFFIGPRINAIGRLSDSSIALDLLLEEDENKAKLLAGQLDSANKQRQTQQEHALAEAIELLPKNMENQSVLLVSAKNWHPGLVGLVAGKLVEMYKKPALVCVVDSEGNAKGSCRSTPGFNMLDALEHCKKYLKKFGGHAVAAGFELLEENINPLREALNDYALGITNGELLTPKKVYHIDSRLPFSDITDNTFDKLTELSPFGSQNDEPLFLVTGLYIESIVSMGSEQKHLKFKFKEGEDTKRWVEGIAWRMGHRKDEFEKGKYVDVIAKMSVNEFAGRKTLGLVIEDITPSK